MTTLADPVREEQESARAATTPREAWRKVRVPVAVGAGFALLAIVEGLVTGGVSANRLDPDSAGREGARALATILRDHGVDVRTVDAPSGDPDTTVFVPFPDLVAVTAPSALTAAGNARELVVAEPNAEELDAMRVPVAVSAHPPERVVDPACDQPDATAAGDVRLGGKSFGAPENAVTCYPIDGVATMVEVETFGRRITVLGSGSLFTNERLGDHGNAALALRLLTRHPTVEWVYPRHLHLPDSGEGGTSVFDLLPHRFWVAFAEVLVAFLLLALWRGRRLGPVVAEPLPVVVRAAEAVEGRARLYESAHARGRAADALRAGLRDRLVRALGLAPDAARETLVAAVTARTHRDAIYVDSLLYGPPPADDEALVRLAAALDQLDSEVRAQ